MSETFGGWLYITVLSYPGTTEPDPTQITELEQVRPAVDGENGYAALHKLPLTNKDWPEELPRCKPDTPRDCLAFAREHLATYREVALQIQQTWQAQEQAVENLRRYSYFRPSAEQLAIDSPTPPYQLLFMQQDLHAYRFAAGEREQALPSTCRDANLALRMLDSHGSLLESIVAARLLRRDIDLLARMRAELPPNHPLPADCDALRSQPAETIALCPLMYSEWLTMSDVTNRLHTPDSEKLQGKALLEKMFAIMKNQTDRQRLYESRKYCAPEIIAAVARDEAAPPVADDWPRYCSPLNILCRVAQAHFKTYPGYQARLLNANRYLRAFELLQHPKRHYLPVIAAMATGSPSACIRKKRTRPRQPSPCRCPAAVSIAKARPSCSPLPFFIKPLARPISLCSLIPTSRPTRYSSPSWSRRARRLAAKTAMRRCLICP